VTGNLKERLMNTIMKRIEEKGVGNVGKESIRKNPNMETKRTKFACGCGEEGYGYYILLPLKDTVSYRRVKKYIWTAMGSK